MNPKTPKPLENNVCLIRYQNLFISKMTSFLKQPAPKERLAQSKTQSLLFDRNFVKREQEKKIVKGSQRFVFSPVTKKMDLDKTAWDRLLERSFDQRTVQLIKAKQKQMESKTVKKPQSGNGIFSTPTPSSPKVSVLTGTPKFEQGNKDKAIGGKCGIWNELLNKTQDFSPASSCKEHYRQRIEEGKRSVRIIKSPSPKSSNTLETHLNHEISGCARQIDPRKNQHSLKLQYGKDELSRQEPRNTKFSPAKYQSQVDLSAAPSSRACDSGPKPIVSESKKAKLMKDFRSQVDLQLKGEIQSNLGRYVQFQKGTTSASALKNLSSSIQIGYQVNDVKTPSKSSHIGEAREFKNRGALAQTFSKPIRCENGKNQQVSQIMSLS